MTEYYCSNCGIDHRGGCEQIDMKPTIKTLVLTEQELEWIRQAYDSWCNKIHPDNSHRSKCLELREKLKDKI